MNLREGENILYVYRHHFLPFFVRIFQLALVSIPVLLLLYPLSKSLPTATMLIIYTVVFGIFSLAALYITLIYWLDKLIVTNQRVVFVDWKLLTAISEIETEIRDVQDIKTHSKGLLSSLPFFNFGEIEIETASYSETINFPEASDPEGIKSSIHMIRRNCDRIHRAPTPDTGYVGLDTYDIMPRDEERSPNPTTENPVR